MKPLPTLTPTRKRLRYTIKAVLDVETGNLEDVQSALDTLRENGTAEVEDIEIIDG
jgi:hypothetical protein